MESREGAGTTFKLYFPVVRQEFTVEKEVRTMNQYAGRGESVLVVAHQGINMAIKVALSGRNSVDDVLGFKQNNDEVDVWDVTRQERLEMFVVQAAVAD